MPSLGECEKCHGPLCISSAGLHCDPVTGDVSRVAGIIKCEKCGLAHPEHPTSVAMRQHFEKEQARPPAVTQTSRMDYAATMPDRINALEKLTAAQGEQIRRLEQALSEATGATTMAGHKRR